MVTVFHIYFENIHCYFTEFNIVQKLKYTNKVGVTSWQLFGQNKIGMAVQKALEIHFIFWSYLHIFICILKQSYLS